MAKLEITLSKDKFDALEDGIKEFYKATQDGQYELDGVGSIQRALEAEKAGKKTAIDAAVAKAVADAMKPFEGVDLDAAKAAIAAAAKAEEEKLTASGSFDELKKQLEDRHTLAMEKKEEELAVAVNAKNAILANLKHEKLANVLTEKGVLPDRVKYLAGELEAELELATVDNGFVLKKIGGIGDAPEFDAIIENAKAKTPFFFASDNATGSGASGSNGNGGSQNAQRLTKAQVKALDPDAKRDFYKGVETHGNEVIDH